MHAAQAAAQVRAWGDEVRGWAWPAAGFRPPAPHAARAIHGDGNDPYLGALPASTVARLEQRIAAVRAARAALDLDALKMHARGAHLVPDAAASMPYRPLDDLTVVTTATVVQMLPHLDRLDRLLELWSVRLFVLRLVPPFLRQLDDARVALDSARHATEKAVDEGLTRKAFVVMRRVLQERIAELGQTIDGMLDALEGREDRIPDGWIDDMEDAQAEYELWAVRAEKLMEAHELGAQTEMARKKASVEMEGAGQGTTTAAEVSDQPKSNAIEAPAGKREIADAPRNLDEALPETPPTNQQDFDAESFMTPQEELSMDDLLSTGALGVPFGVGQISPSRPKASLDDVFADVLAGQEDPTDPVSPLDFHDANEAPSPTISKRSGRSMDGVSDVPGDASSIHSGQRQNNLSILHINGGSPARSAPPRPGPLSIRTDDVLQSESDVSDLSQPTTSSSSRFSDMSSPQILDASAIHYFKTPIDEHPPMPFSADDADLARQNSQRTERGAKSHGRSFSAADALSRSRASSYISEVTVGARTPAVQEAQETPRKEADEPVDSGISLSTASRTSIESLSRSQVMALNDISHSCV